MKTYAMSENTFNKMTAMLEDKPFKEVIKLLNEIKVVEPTQVENPVADEKPENHETK
jgi:hypothetical protein